MQNLRQPSRLEYNPYHRLQRLSKSLYKIAADEHKAQSRKLVVEILRIVRHLERKEDERDDSETCGEAEEEQVDVDQVVEEDRGRCRKSRDREVIEFGGQEEYVQSLKADGVKASLESSVGTTLNDKILEADIEKFAVKDDERDQGKTPSA